VERRRAWPLFLIGLPAAVAVWSGWVGLGGMCGFGIIHPLPGIFDSFELNTAITLPVGVEAYGGYALGVWADGTTPEPVRKFAFRSAIGSLALGLLGQVVFHLLDAAGFTRAPWPVVVFVSCIPVAALGFGMGLHQMLTHARSADDEPADAGAQPEPVLVPAAKLLDELAQAVTLSEPEPEPWPDTPLPELGGELTDSAIEALLADWARPVVPAAKPKTPRPAARRRQQPGRTRAAAEPKPGDPPAEVVRAAASAQKLATTAGISRWRAQELMRPGSYALADDTKPVLTSVNGSAREEQAG
jgi:pyruvate/2-oxoglutarate dehydrogenase complex dihydrolipoamide acyltransferase (E2) component